MRRRFVGSPSRSQRLSPAGYTLIELAIVLVLTGILLAIAIPRLHPVLEHGKVNAAASVLAVDLQYAQMLAARQRRPVLVIVDPSTRQYLIRDRPAGGTIFRTRLLGEDTQYSLDELNSTISGIEIFPTGITRSLTTLTVGLGGYRRRVLLTRAGQIRVLSGS